VATKNKIDCQFCNKPAQLVDGTVVYPHRPDLKRLNFWFCDKGHDAAYVGCHKPNCGYGDGTRPLGTLANIELRYERKRAHEAFDWIWREGMMKRTEAYIWLAHGLGIEDVKRDCHIAMFDADQCRRAVKLCAEHFDLQTHAVKVMI